MSVPFEYGVGYVPGDHDPNLIYFGTFSGYPSTPIQAIVVYPSAPSPVTVNGYLSQYNFIVTAFNVTSGDIRNDQQPDLVTFYPLFTISYVSATQTSITFAWSGLAQPNNYLIIGCAEDLIDSVVGTDMPASGTYTVTGSTPSTTYYDCYFQDAYTFLSTNLIDASTLPNRWQLVQTLTPSPIIRAISSALSADGSTIISGGDIGNNPACIFRVINGQFEQVTTIQPTIHGNFFGEEVAVDARGQVFGISCTDGDIIPTPDRLSGLDSKLVTFNLTSSVDVQGNVYVSGTISGNFPVRTNQSGSTIDVLASDYYIGVNGTGVTVRLPTGVPTGKTYVIKDESGTASTNHITLSGNGNTIDGSATLTMVANYMSLQVIWTGSFWSII